MSSNYRKQRRHKARNKAYTPRPSGGAPMIVGAHLVLSPLERIVEQIESDGTVHVDAKGVPVFQAGDGQWYDAAGAIEGVMWHFEALEVRAKRTLPLDGLRELVIAFRYCVPVMQTTLSKLNVALPVLRRALALGRADDQLDILQQTRIRAELEAKGMTIDTQKLRKLLEQAGTPTLYIRTNRHPETDGRPWGWVSEHPPGGHNTSLCMEWTSGEKSDYRAQLLVRVVNGLPGLLDHIDAQAAEIAHKDAEIARLRGLVSEMAENDTYETEYDGRMYSICHGCGAQDGEDHRRADCVYVRASAALSGEGK